VLAAEIIAHESHPDESCYSCRTGYWGIEREIRYCTAEDGVRIAYALAGTVRWLGSGKGFLFADRGEFVAKGFEDPVRVYEVRWKE
jgi:hypothetical protein